jgi:hypothetical protein
MKAGILKYYYIKKMQDFVSGGFYESIVYIYRY